MPFSVSEPNGSRKPAIFTPGSLTKFFGKGAKNRVQDSFRLPILANAKKPIIMDRDQLFILIIIVTVIINIIKAVRKRGQAAEAGQPRPVATEQREYDDFEDILKKVMDPKKRSESYTDQEEQSLETLNPMGGSLESISEYEWKPPVYTTSAAMSELSETLYTEDPQEDESHKSGGKMRSAGEKIRWQPGDPIDFRTAVIYQTILERPNL